jgi:transcriptional regulator with XRE-family HTH domain
MLKKEEIQRLRDLRDQGYSYAEIAEKTGYSIKTAYKYCSEKQNKRESPPPPPLVENIEQAHSTILANISKNIEHLRYAYNTEPLKGYLIEELKKTNFLIPKDNVDKALKEIELKNKNEIENLRNENQELKQAIIELEQELCRIEKLEEKIELLESEKEILLDKMKRFQGLIYTLTMKQLSTACKQCGYLINIYIPDLNEIQFAIANSLEWNVFCPRCGWKSYKPIEIVTAVGWAALYYVTPLQFALRPIVLP